jgi:hypothetical protein
VLQRESGGTKRLAGDGEGRNLDDLALATSRCASLLLRLRDVSLGGDGVATVSRQHGKQGVLDGAHLGIHVSTIRQSADLWLTPD